MLQSHSNKLLLLVSKFPLAWKFAQTTNGSVWEPHPSTTLSVFLFFGTKTRLKNGYLARSQKYVIIGKQHSMKLRNCKLAPLKLTQIEWKTIFE